MKMHISPLYNSNGRTTDPVPRPPIGLPALLKIDAKRNSVSHWALILILASLYNLGTGWLTKANLYRAVYLVEQIMPRITYFCISAGHLSYIKARYMRF
ncbi:hypothetical protein F4678DRAFT_421974 [Xylaria arbuscula]|nr:hypothetical protein F4678DRAFT_421974 [Xylaria arbuscula]